MARPKSDVMDQRNAPLRSHPPDKPLTQGVADKEGDRAAITPPCGSLFENMPQGRSQEQNQQQNQSVSLSKRRGHSELPPIQTSSLAGVIPNSSAGGLDHSNSDISAAQSFLTQRLNKSPFLSNKFAVLGEEEQDDGRVQHDDSQESKDEEEYHKFRASLQNSLEDDSPIEREDREQRDSLVAEQQDQIKLFRSSLLAGAKARDDRRGRVRRTPPAIDDDPQIGPNVASESESHASTIVENKDNVVPIQDSVVPVQDNGESSSSLSETLNPDNSFNEETEESLDRLIAELEVEDGNEPDVDEVTIRAEETPQYPPALLETNVDEGLNDDEVVIRRKKYGWNRLKEHKRNHFMKFLSFLMGPVQWVMEVSKTVNH
jgi:H+-transporting ATPase